MIYIVLLEHQDPQDDWSIYYSHMYMVIFSSEEGKIEHQLERRTSGV